MAAAAAAVGAGGAVHQGPSAQPGVDGCDSAAAIHIAQGLDGNLCRCTGWRPIIDACRVGGACRVTLGQQSEAGRGRAVTGALLLCVLTAYMWKGAAQYSNSAMQCSTVQYHATRYIGYARGVRVV